MTRKIVVIVRQSSLGSVAPQDLLFGREMLDKFLHTLEGLSPKPQAICFYTEGVKLTCDGSPVVFSLQLLERMGVRIITCTSCLEYYKLESSVAVGERGTMREIVQLALEADSVVTV